MSAASAPHAWPATALPATHCTPAAEQHSSPPHAVPPCCICSSPSTPAPAAAEEGERRARQEGPKTWMNSKSCFAFPCSVQG